jgi:hypothetical protein
MAEIGGALWGGVAKVVPQIIILGLGTWAGGYILRGIGKGQYVELMNVIALFVGFGMTLATVIGQVLSAFKALGIIR